MTWARDPDTRQVVKLSKERPGTPSRSTRSMVGRVVSIAEVESVIFDFLATGERLNDQLIDAADELGEATADWEIARAKVVDGQVGCDAGMSVAERERRAVVAHEAEYRRFQVAKARWGALSKVCGQQELRLKALQSVNANLRGQTQ